LTTRKHECLLAVFPNSINVRLALQEDSVGQSEDRRGRHRTNAVQRALAHPIRAQLLAALRNGPASPSEMAPAVEQSIGVVSYHVRILVEAGLVDLVGTQPKRGALQHFYVARDDDTVGVTLQLDPESAAALQRDLRARVAEAQRLSDGRPGKVTVTVVLHAEAA